MAVTAAGFTGSAVSAAPPATDPAASEVVTGLLSLSRALGEAAVYPALSDDLPLTDVSLRDALLLDTAIASAVRDAVTGQSPTLATLPAVFAASNGPLSLTAVGTPTGTPLQWDLAVDLTGDTPVALRYDDQRLRFGSGQLDGELAASLRATMRIQYDANALALRRFSVVGSSTLTVRAWTRASGSDATSGSSVAIPPFPVIDGFVALDGQGTATIDTTTVLTLRDPNGRGALTTEDLEFGSADELLALRSQAVPAGEVFDVDVALSSELLAPGTRGSVRAHPLRTTTADTYGSPVVTRDTSLADLTSLTRAQAVGSFSQFAAAIVQTESYVDAELPLLDAHVTDVFSPAKRMNDLIAEEAAATILCGAANTTPPSGAARPGQVRYCQATTNGTAVDATQPIVWSSPEIGVSFTGSTANTVAPSPTANVAVTGGGGFPRLVVSFTGTDGKVRVARTATTSIQELAQLLDEVGLGGTLSYSAAVRAIEIALYQEDPDVAGLAVATGGTGGLAPSTGLTGLCQASPGTSPRTCPRTGDGPGAVPAPAGQASLTATGRIFDATFGIGLVPPAAEPAVGDSPAVAATAYLKPPSDGIVWAIGSMAATLPANAPLTARIGFLQVDVDVTSYVLSSGSKPAARVTLPTTESVTLDGGTVARGIELRRLFPPIEDTTATDTIYPDLLRGLSAAAQLRVSDSPVRCPALSDPPGPCTRLLGAAGTVSATWATLTEGVPPTVTTAGAYDALRALDVVPTRQGVAGDGTAGARLVDPDADFVRQFGVDLAGSVAERTVTRPFNDFDIETDVDPTSPTGTLCSAFVVVNAHTVDCTKGPIFDARAIAGMLPGDRYQMLGVPTALRDALIESLASVLNVYGTPDPALGFADTLPLVDLRPDQISGSRDAIGDLLAAVQGEAADDAGAAEVSTLQGFDRSISRLAPGTTGAWTLSSGVSPRLELDLFTSTDPEVVWAPLRVAVDTKELRVFGPAFEGVAPRVDLPLAASSSARMRVGIDLSDGAALVHKDTALVEKVDGFTAVDDQVRASLAEKDAEFGAVAGKTGGAGQIAVDIGVQVRTARDANAAEWIPLSGFRGAVLQERTIVGLDRTCGDDSSAVNDADDPGRSSDNIAACATIPLVSDEATPRALTTIRVALEADQSSGGQGGSLEAEPLAFWFVVDGLAAFARTLADGLDGDIVDMALPLVGTDLDGGADIPAAVSSYAARARTALSGTEIASDATAASLGTAIEAALEGAATTDLAVTASVELMCGVVACIEGKLVADVSEIRAPMTLLGTTTGASSPFQVGLAGFNLDSNLDVDSSNTWTLTVTPGIRRGTGPFVLLVPADGQPTVPVLTEHVTTQLKTYDAARCHGWARAAGSWAAEYWKQAEVDAGIPDVQAVAGIPENEASTSRCIDALVGKFPAVLVDHVGGSPDTARTGVDATLTLSVAPGNGGAGPADASGRVYLPALFDRKLPITTTAVGSGGLDVYFESFASSIGFFDVLGSISLSWTDGVFDEAGAAFSHLQIDAATVYDLLDVGYNRARKYLTWFNPVADVLSYEIPVVSDLAKMVGQPPITMLFLLAKLAFLTARKESDTGAGKVADEKKGARRGASVQLVAKVIEFQQLIARLPGSDGTELVKLGSGRGGFAMPTTTLKFNSCAKTLASGRTVQQDSNNLSGRCTEGVGSANRRRKGGVGDDAAAGKNIQKEFQKSTYFELPSITVPVLEDAAQVFDMISGVGDTTLLHVDLGRIGGKVGLYYNFGPLAMLLPVPVFATVGVEVDIGGRFAFGFDTRALSMKIEQLDEVGAVRDLTPTDRGQVFSDGFYIDDLDDGVDVPEISISATFFAGASVKLALAEAGLRGGVVLDLLIDAHDPNGDGKIYATEFAGGTNPDCAFNVSSGLTFFLSFFLYLKLFIFEVSKTWDIYRSPRITLFEFNCAPVTPVLAYRDGLDLRLTMGPRADRRNAYADVTAEKYTVRQLGTDLDGTRRVEVAAFNLVQAFTIPTGGKLFVDAGSGDDIVKLAAGQLVTTTSAGTTVTSVPFTIDAVVDGGDGNDKITTEGGADIVTGGAGNDTITTGAGNDTVSGGDGDDTIDAGQGEDVVDGGAGNDHLEGGAGADDVRGGTGDDLINGGLGVVATQVFGTDLASMIGPMLDSGDLVVGGTGSDRVDGGDGSDLVVGGTTSLTADMSAERSVNVFGVSITGRLLLLTVTLPTLRMPTLVAIRAECATPGEVTAGERDQVSGGGDDDYVVGGGGNDELSGGGGTDLVCGRDGDDLLLGDGSDVDPRAERADELLGGPGNDRLYGAGGDDVLRGELGNDFLRGGAGADGLEGGAGADVVVGEDGDDTVGGDLLDGSGVAALSEGSGRDIVCRIDTSIVGGGIDLNRDLSADGLDDGRLEGLEVVDGVVHGVDGLPFTGVIAGVVFAAGRVDLNGNGSIESYRSSAPGDTGAVALVGTLGATGNGDCLLGGEGADSLLGGAGGDYIDAGAGADNARGGFGDDVVRGGAGDDEIEGNDGNDLIAGDSGEDRLYGGAGDDVVRGGSGNDLLIGGSATADATDGRDELLGDGGDDVLAGGNASMLRTGSNESAITGRTVTLLATPASGGGLDDQLFGGYGNDWAFGQGGDDLVRGGPDNDVVEGGPGADTVQGDDGDDLVIGGSSTDGAVTLTRSGEGLSDGADIVRGDGGVDNVDGNDVLAGDNARLGFGTGGVRDIQLFDVQLATSTPPAVPTSGDDQLFGGGGNDVMFGQGGNDDLAGGDGEDVIEGNAGNDTVLGGSGQDDIIGGGSAADGRLSANAQGRLLTSVSGPVDSGAAGMVDGDDDLDGGDGSDVILGDNGRIVRAGTDVSGTRARRTVAMADTGPGVWAGSDLIDGGDGDDDLYGQFDLTGTAASRTFNGHEVRGDVLRGGAGDDTLVGDQGIVVPTAAASLGAVNTTISAGSRFAVETVRVAGTIIPVVTLLQPDVGGDDILLGEAGRDSLHGGAGDDLADGGDDNDVLFGGDGADVLWGGTGHDVLFGGAGKDMLDIKARPGDPTLWDFVRPSVDDDGTRATVNGADTIYGGSGADALQADVGDQARTPGDRLMDWTGTSNIFLVCTGAYGAGKVLTASDPTTQKFLSDLATATGSVGAGEVALVKSGGEATPRYPGAPGNFTCEP